MEAVASSHRLRDCRVFIPALPHQSLNQFVGKHNRTLIWIKDKMVGLGPLQESQRQEVDSNAGHCGTKQPKQMCVASYIEFSQSLFFSSSLQEFLLQLQRFKVPEYFKSPIESTALLGMSTTKVWLGHRDEKQSSQGDNPVRR